MFHFRPNEYSPHSVRIRLLEFTYRNKEEDFSGFFSKVQGMYITLVEFSISIFMYVYIFFQYMYLSMELVFFNSKKTYHCLCFCYKLYNR
jgi:hypothetical protein